MVSEPLPNATLELCSAFAFAPIAKPYPAVAFDCSPIATDPVLEATAFEPLAIEDKPEADVSTPVAMDLNQLQNYAHQRP